MAGGRIVTEWLPELKMMVPQIWAEAYHYYKHDEQLFLSQELETEANAVQNAHSSILNDPLLEDIELYLDREVPESYAKWPIPQRLSYQQGLYEPEFPEHKVRLDMVCVQQIIRELPNDMIRRMPQKHTPNYINKLMEQVVGWERSKQEKVSGLHPDYCDKTGRCKRPWLRVPTETSVPPETPPTLFDAPF